MAIPIYTEERQEAQQSEFQEEVDGSELVGESETDEDFVAQFARDIGQVYKRFFGRLRSQRRRRQIVIPSETPVIAPINGLPDLLCCHGLLPTRTTSSRVVPDVDVDPSGLGLDVKIAIDFSYGRIGRQLRTIADSYHPQQNSSRSRRRHPAGPQVQLSVQVHLLLPLTIIACCTFAYMKKS